MRNITIGRKLTALIALLVIMTAIVGVVTLTLVSGINSNLKVLSKDHLASAETLGRMVYTAQGMRVNILTLIMSPRKDLRAEYALQVAEQDKAFRSLLGEFEKLSSANQQAAKEHIVPAYEHFLGVWAKIDPLARSANRKAADLWTKEGRPAAEAVAKALAAELDTTGVRGESTAETFIASAERARMWVFGLVIGAALAGGILGFLFVRGTNRSLLSVICELNQSSTYVAEAAQQVSASSRSLAEYASDQAASLEETSASAEEITSMTRKNAESSSNAADLMTAVDQHVKESNSTLEQMVVSMTEINASSGKISQIIKVIDEIAFQTNILALNAAVEAARAGEAGMGFAVVAGEVRNLAQRSAQAAKDTAALIEESIAKSNEGSTNLKRVTDAIRAITESASKVKTLVDEVNVASQEQARGVDEISKAVNRMSQVTQESAANSGENVSAGERLSKEAASMHAAVLRLRSIVTKETESVMTGESK